MTHLYLHSIRLPYDILKSRQWEELLRGDHLRKLGHFYEHRVDTAGRVYTQGDLERWIKQYKDDPAKCEGIPTPLNIVDALVQKNQPIPFIGTPLRVFPLAHRRGLKVVERKVISEYYSRYEVWDIQVTAVPLFLKWNQ